MKWKYFIYCCLCWNK